MSNLSQRLAAHVAEARFEHLSAEAVEAAKRSLFDAIAVSLAASGQGEGVDAFVNLALANGGATEASIFGRSVRVPAQMAALANGAMAHAMDFEDAFDGAPLHPNAALVPAALAVAEARGGVSGKDLIAAIAIGCDLTCRLALCLRTPSESLGWYPPPIFGAYGAVAAAGRIVGLDAQGMLDAFSLTLCQATCSGEIKNSPDSVIRAVRDAFSAQAGVLSAQLAQRGVRGFARPFDGEFGFFRLYANADFDADILLADLGRRFYGAEVSFKPWPSCRGTHPFIEAALRMRDARLFAPDDIKAVRLEGGALQQMLAKPLESKRAPRTLIDAKFSSPFVSALALVRGQVTLADFTPESLQDEAILALAARVTHDVAESWTNAASGAMTLEFKSGEALSEEIAIPLGSPSRPMSWDALVEKAAACFAVARTPLAPAKADELARVIQSLDARKNAVADVLAVLG